VAGVTTVLALCLAACRSEPAQRLLVSAPSAPVTSDARRNSDPAAQ